MIAKTPVPPYYAVIFTSIRTSGENGYSDMSEAMVKTVQQQPGFLGFETARNETGITVSYWKDEESIRKWRDHEAHKIARQKGRSTWYSAYKVRICIVDRDYELKTD